MSEPRSLGTVLKAMLLAGLLAGAVLAAFHAVLTEPIIDQAIALEEARAGHQEEVVPLISRDTQKAGLLIGSLLFGVFAGIIFGGVFYLAQTALPARRVLTNAVLLAIAAYWLVSLLPFLKYPANPPGVGQPESIEYRQALYIAFLLLSITGGLLATKAAGYMRRRWLAVAGYTAFAVALYTLMPPNPDPIEVPLQVVESFRALSLAGLTIFWLVLGLSFGLLAERLQPDGRAPGFQPSAA